MTRPSLGDTLALATIAHAGQPYGNQPYITHPVAVTRLLLPLSRAYGNGLLHAGLLHDVIEDTDVTIDDLWQFGYDREVVETVDSVTRRGGETYADFVQRAARHPYGRLVKLADNTHNRSTLDRSDRRWGRYERARTVLLAAIGSDPFTVVVAS